MFMEMVNSKIFGSADVKLESALKNPNQFREAVVFETLSNLPSAKIKEFIKSDEAKAMMEAGVINQDMINRLADGNVNTLLRTTVCHMAKEEDDPLWDELVSLRIQERRVMNDLIAKYGDKSAVVMKAIDKEFVEASIPEYFRK